MDLRVSKQFSLRGSRLEVIAEAFNVANHRNWILLKGVRTATNFRKPASASSARELRLETELLTRLARLGFALFSDGCGMALRAVNERSDL